MMRVDVEIGGGTDVLELAREESRETLPNGPLYMLLLGSNM